MSKSKKLVQVINNAFSQLKDIGITFGKFGDPTMVRMYGEEFIVPIHNERIWFKRYVEDCLKRGMNPNKIEDIAREAYALLRYKQALAGSSDGSGLGAIFALSGHVEGYKAKMVYQRALEEYDSKRKKLTG